MRTEKETKYLKIALLMSALILCAVMLPRLPNEFYSSVRWIVCAAAIFASFSLRHDTALKMHLVPLAILATLFNPFIPVQLSPILWLIIDLGTAVYFLTLSKKI